MMTLLRLDVLTLLLISLSIIAPPAHAAIFSLPMQQEKGWELLEYSSIKSNEVTFTQEGISIKINGSAGPLIYPLPKPMTVLEVFFELQIFGDVNFTDKKQGSKDADDFVFRLGLVYEGTKTLNFFQRSLAADWVKQLFSLAPEGTGVAHIEFYTIYSDNLLKNTRRQHPLSDMIYERYLFDINKRSNDNGGYTGRFMPTHNARVLAIWISCDGDDTQSKFDILIKNIELKSR